MFFKRENKKEIDVLKSFNQIMNIARCWTENKTNAERLPLLDYLITSMINEICADMVVKSLISSPQVPLEQPFCTYFFDENNIKHSIYTDNEVNVNLADIHIYVCPWDNNRTLSALTFLVNEAFEYQKNNHSSYFYPDINLCYVYNGNHSINAGRYFKKGNIKSKVCKLELMYQHCITDGLFWYNKHTGNKLSPVDDFRFAAVYSLAQLRFNLKMCY